MDKTSLFFLFTATISVVIILFNIIYSQLVSIPGRRYKKQMLEENLPPEAKGGWPVIGHLRFLSGPELPHIVLSNMADMYGPIFTIRLGVYRALIVSSWEGAKECFTTNDVVLSNRPKTAAIRHMGYNFAMFGFSAYGSYWRRLRMISMFHLLSNSKIAELGNVFELEIRAMIRKLYESSSSSRAEKATHADMKKIFGEMTLGLMLRIILGRGGEDRRDTDAAGVGQKLRDKINEFFRMMGELTVPDVVPFLKWLNYIGGTNEDSFKKTGMEMDRILQAWLEDRKTCNHSGFMAEMMVAAHEVAGEFPQYDADTITKATCQTMIFGGAAMTMVTLTWALSLLLNNRHIIERAQHELDTHVGPHRQVKASDIENLVYIQAIIKETFRLYPPSPLLPPRESTGDCTVGGYRVEPGTRLIVNVWKLHRDHRVWVDPLEFRPDRFLTSHKDFDVRGRHFELLPFGAGRRICPGIGFALQLTTHALASLLHGFDIETVSDEAVDMTGSLGATNIKSTPLEVLLRPRLLPGAYV
ncbi:hypothetical protein OROGR_009462 [Orobanche gracilis]